MEKVLISRCLLGERVRYDGDSNPINNDTLNRWLAEGRVIGICPEVSGGLPTPRPPAERQPDGTIITIDGSNVTGAFSQGAENALALCDKHQIKLAILKQSSPSCGSKTIYDGTFSGNKVAGEGVTTALLRHHGIQVFCENTLTKAIALLRQLEDLERSAT